jgi:ribosomal protein L10
MRAAILEKRKKIEELREEISKYKVFFLFSFGKLSANEMFSLRKELKEKAKAKFKVVKNIILKRTLEELSGAYQAIASEIEGPSAISLADDVVELAKVWRNYSEKLIPKRGLLDGKVTLDTSSLKKAMSLPDYPQMLSTLISTIKLPYLRLILTLNNPIQRLIFILSSISKEKKD